MSNKLSKKNIIKKTFEFGLSSIISKVLAIIRDILQIRYLGLGPLSDAFLVAYKIPNVLRKVFAEGALSAAFIPTLVKLLRQNKEDEANKLISGLLIFISGILVLICTIIIIFPKAVIFIYANGFFKKGFELSVTVKLIRILISFILFISMGSILSGALQAKHQFGPTAWAPVILNIVYISALLTCTYLNLSVYKFAFLILFGAILQSLFFLYYYKKFGFRFIWPDKSIKKYFQEIIFKFLPCIISMSTLELNAAIDERFGSTLSAGTYTLMDIAFKFMGIALSIFASGFASILLPYFSHVTDYAQKRLSFYIFQANKLIAWVTLPATLIIIFLANKIIYTTFYKYSGSHFTLSNVNQTSNLLIAYSSGLFFYSLNKILLSLYYSMQQMLIPTLVTVIGCILNIIFNFLLINKMGAVGLALATSLSAGLQSIIFLTILYFRFNFKIYLKAYTLFIIKLILQVSLISSLFYFIYNSIYYLINYHLIFLRSFLLEEIGLWLWVSPLIILIFLLLYKTRKLFGIKIYFLS